MQILLFSHLPLMTYVGTNKMSTERGDFSFPCFKVILHISCSLEWIGGAISIMSFAMTKIAIDQLWGPVESNT